MTQKEELRSLRAKVVEEIERLERDNASEMWADPLVLAQLMSLRDRIDLELKEGDAAHVESRG